MWGLIYKDLCICKKTILIAVAATLILPTIFLIVIPLIAYTPEEEAISDMIMVSSLIGSFLFYICWIDMTTAFISADERKLWSGFVSSSSVNAKGHVQSKYCEGIIVLVFLFNFCYIFLNIADVIIYQKFNFSETASVINQAFLMAWLLMAIWAIEMPFTFYFGSKYGNYIKLCLLAIVMIIIFIIILYGSKELSFDKLWEIVMSEEPSMKMQIFSAAFPFAASALYYISYRISCKIYLKGAEKFE